MRGSSLTVLAPSRIWAERGVVVAVALNLELVPIRDMKC
jgi:hypothetical protein